MTFSWLGLSTMVKSYGFRLQPNPLLNYRLNLIQRNEKIVASIETVLIDEVNQFFRGSEMRC